MQTVPKLPDAPLDNLFEKRTALLWADEHRQRARIAALRNTCNQLRLRVRAQCVALCVLGAACLALLLYALLA